MALLDMGDVPWKRGSSTNSERLEQSWHYKTAANGLSVVLGNDTSYGPYVQGEQQSLYMQSAGWKPVEAVVNAEGPVVIEQIVNGLEAEIAAVEV
jgi:hypothetical protein